MKTWNLAIASPLLSLLLGACNRESPQSRDADDTSQNERDRSTQAITAEDQGENEVDREISANIRKAIVADDSLSLNAHNIKIITLNQMVTLRGPVKSAEEKASIEVKAKQVAGIRSIDNLLEVEANP